MATIQVIAGVVLVAMSANASSTASLSAVVFFTVMGLIFFVKGMTKL
jgi:hypothetical protein